MKSVYWRPQKVSPGALVFLALVSACGLLLVQQSPCPTDPASLERRLAAAQHAVTAMQAVKQERLRRGHTLDAALDPAGTGMLGDAMTLVTSRPAELAAKRTSVNPNFAAVVLQLLEQAGVQPGDTIAVGWTGSFPALNLALCAACETLQLQPIAVASATSSQYGANRPDFLWIDMERTLHEADLISFRSQAVSRGGAADRAAGMSAEAIALIDAAIQRNGLPQLVSSQLHDAIEQRMQLFHHAAGQRPIKAYVNVGGGIASTGGSTSKGQFQPGLNRQLPADGEVADSVMKRFLQQGTPVVHLSSAETLAQQYGLSIAPVTLPPLGEGHAFQPHRPNRLLAATMLGMILALSRALIVTDWGCRAMRFLQALAQQADRPRLELVRKPAPQPELMV